MGVVMKEGDSREGIYVYIQLFHSGVYSRN